MEGNNETVRVLVVDDERSIRSSLSAFLEDLEFDVCAAASAEEAIKLLEAAPAHIALVDLRLPLMSGETLILKLHHMCPTMRFIVHTGSSNYRVSDELKGIGIRQEHVFLKPIRDLDALETTIQKLLNSE